MVVFQAYASSTWPIFIPSFLESSTIRLFQHFTSSMDLVIRSHKRVRSTDSIITSAFLRVTEDMVIRSHRHVGSTGSNDHPEFSYSCNSSFALKYVRRAPRHRLMQHRLLSPLAKHTNGSSKPAFGHTLDQITLQILFFFHTTPSIFRRLCTDLAVSHSFQTWASSD